MSSNFFEKIGEDMKKNFQKFQKDVNDLLGIKKPVAEDAVKQPQLPEKSGSGGDSQSVAPAASESQKLGEVMNQNWNSFVSTSKQNFEKMQDQWNQNVTNVSAKFKAQNDKNLVAVQEINKNMKNFFSSQQQKMNDTFKQLEQDMRTKNIQNRENFFKFVSDAQENWEKFVETSQKRFEHGLDEMNKLSWKGQIRFILYLLPILILVALIFSLIRPFIM